MSTRQICFNRYIKISVLVLFCVALPIVWYTVPYSYRKMAYLAFDRNVYDDVLSAEDFNISLKGFSYEYDLHNSYVMPMVVQYRFTELPDSVPTGSTFPFPLVPLTLKISAQITINNQVKTSIVSSNDIHVGYSISAATHNVTSYIYLFKLAYPLELRFSKNAKIRFEVIETDGRLSGGKGSLVITPDYEM